MDSTLLFDLSKLGITGIAAIFSIITVIGAFRSGVLTKIRLGSFEIAADTDSKERANIEGAIVSSVTGRDEIPFEVEQLTNYYTQVLSQSKVAFWFSLVFASLGFVAIMVAAFFYGSTTSGSTVAQFIAGTIMEAVASLFFVQSKNAQKSMGEFFDKLRSDRLHLESRKMCDAIQNPQTQDALKLNLALHYAGVPNSEVIAKQISEVVHARP
ncbi:hypothetical protein WJ45_27300 [Burkholderia ubonensis]|nr:hypothetical protein WJ45_27300 [Burkholderia ubonensis]KVQ44808.1 hypothetical protein WK04_14375 [Burkholderia ubonensis]